MSANVFCTPVSLETRIICAAPSSFERHMRDAFNDNFEFLQEKDIPVLKGMASIYGETPSSNPYQQIIDIILNNGDVQIKIVA